MQLSVPCLPLCALVLFRARCFHCCVSSLFLLHLFYLVGRLPHFLFILHLGLGWAVFLLAFLDNKHYSLWLGRERATFESDLE
jgi:hypothetical protein